MKMDNQEKQFHQNQSKEYLFVKLMATIQSMMTQGELIEDGDTVSIKGIPRTQRLQNLGKTALEILDILENVVK